MQLVTGPDAGRARFAAIAAQGLQRQRALDVLGRGQHTVLTTAPKQRFAWCVYLSLKVRKGVPKHEA